MLREIGALTLLTLFFVVGCGGGGTPANNLPNGIWLAQLNDAGGITQYFFAAELTQTSGTAVSVSRVSTGTQSCITEQSSTSATFTKSGSSNGIVTGNFSLSLTTTVTASQTNVLTLQGTRGSDGRINGTWTLTGQSGCNDNGNFFMMQPPSV